MHTTVASPQQLSAEIAELALHINRYASADVLRAVGDLDLSLTGCKALLVLERSPELSVKELALALGLSLPAASRAVDGLVQRGLLERRASLEDRRSKLVALSPSGRAAIRVIADSRRAAIEQFAASLSDEERTALHAALLPITERIRNP
jgi:DNA-binding MarR family transcriptional regulator